MLKTLSYQQYSAEQQLCNQYSNMSDILSVQLRYMYWLPHLFFLVILLSSTSAKPNGLNPTGLRNIENCVCVPMRLCKNFQLTNSKYAVMNPSMQENCILLTHVCCPTAEKVIPTPESRIGSPAARPGGCGYRNPDGVGHRIGSIAESDTEFAEFPWMVAVLIEDVDDNGNKNFVYKCGGSLIDRGVVLTAAYCVSASKRGKKFRIRAGEWDFQSDEETLPHQDRDVDSVLMHENYRSATLQNDIALLFLNTPVDPADNIGVACLPPKGTISDSRNCLASGWGASKSTGQYTALKKVELPMVPHDQCQEALRIYRKRPTYNLHSTFVCAGGELGKDTCQGDGGSPLVCPIPGTKQRYQQMGVVSWGVGCGDGSVPGMYANIAELREWIDQKMISKRFDPEVYTY